MEKYLTGKIKSIKKIKNENTYDIQTSSKNFFANGVLVHNSEIILRPNQMCNLSEVIIRKEDTLEDLKNKIRLATILGTLQSTLTNFKYLRKIWNKNTEEERLLGVSLTGIMDNAVMSGRFDITEFDIFCDEKDVKITRSGLSDVLNELKQVSIDTNKEFAKKLNIPQSTAITCTKPSGTVSQLVNSSSGIHTRHSEYYIRTVRADKKDPLAKFLVSQGIYHEDDVTQPGSTYVFSFPIKSPEGAILRNDMNAIQQLEHWMIYSKEYCEHKPSVTINVKEDEWFDVGAWVYKNFDDISGVSFLPYDGGSYRQAPYQEITEEKYEEIMKTSNIDIKWDEFKEDNDNTISSQELACSGGSCEI